MEYSLNKVNTEKFSMDYMKFGSGKNTLVILPGLSITKVLIAAPAIVNQYRLFADDFTVYLFERRSDVPDEYSVGDMADDTAEVLKLLNLSGVCLFGTSQGGMIAMLIAAKYPSLVKKLALGSTALKVDENRGKIIKSWIDLAKAGKKEELCLSMGENVYPESFFEENKTAFSSMSKIVTDEDLRRFIIIAGGARDFDATEAVKKITCPVMVSGDKDDKVLGGDSAPELSKVFGNNSGFTECVYSGYGHAAYDTAPNFKQKLYDFLFDE